MKDLTEIKKYVEKHLNIDKLDKKNRKREYVYARAIYCGLASENTERTLSEIGSLIGKKHDGTLHYLNKTLFCARRYSDLHRLTFDNYVMYKKDKKNIHLKINYKNQTIINLNKEIEYLKSEVVRLKNLKEIEDPQIKWFINSYNDLTEENKNTLIDRNKTILKVLNAMQK